MIRTQHQMLQLQLIELLLEDIDMTVEESRLIVQGPSGEEGQYLGVN